MRFSKPLASRSLRLPTLSPDWRPSHNRPVEREQQILEAAHEAGFDLAGLAPFRAPRDLDRYRAWLAAGHHASMDWLAEVQGLIEDPRRFAPEGRTLLAVGVGHARAAVELEGGGRIARYAAGRDYHNWLRKRLRKLARTLVQRGLVGGARSLVDDGPLMERSHAAEAGLGFASKAANLLHPRFGPWFFLGELVLDTELTPTAPPLPAGSCGTCTACIDACPTGALVAPGQLDARRCLSWATIEAREPLERDLRGQLGEWAFGCDICSEVCPWGEGVATQEARFPTSPAVEGSTLLSWLRLDPRPGAFEERFEGTPLRRPGREGLTTNAALVLGNRPADGAGPALRVVLEEDPSARAREAAAWSLAHGYGEDAGTRAAVERAAAREGDADAARGMRASLDETGRS